MLSISKSLEYLVIIHKLNTLGLGLGSGWGWRGGGDEIDPGPPVKNMDACDRLPTPSVYYTFYAGDIFCLAHSRGSWMITVYTLQSFSNPQKLTFNIFACIFLVFFRQYNGQLCFFFGFELRVCVFMSKES